MSLLTELDMHDIPGSINISCLRHCLFNQLLRFEI